MSRCDYEGAYYRVFCATLLAVALTLTVILTNVFVDLDGLILGWRNDKNQQETTTTPGDVTDIQMLFPEHQGTFSNMDKQDILYSDLKNMEDDTDDMIYRNKRSLDSTDFSFHIKDAKMKNVLTNRLSALLEELDAEDSNSKPKEDTKDKRKPIEITKITEIEADEGIVKEKPKDSKALTNTENELLHLAMHNILLQGIIGHTDLSEVYNKVKSIVKDGDFKVKHNDNAGHVNDRKTKRKKEPATNTSKKTYNMESKLLEEIINCKELHKDVMENFNNVEKKTESGHKKSPKMLIKTIIDIKPLYREKDNDNSSKEIVKGIIKLMYNGKSVKFNQLDEKDEFFAKIKAQEPTITSNRNNEKYNVEVKEDKNTGHMKVTGIPISIVKDALTEYFTKHSNIDTDITNKRQKRHLNVRRPRIKITGNKAQPDQKHKKDEDELYIEIETHFNSKGINAEKKKKIVHSIIEKIQKAISSDLKVLNKKTPKKPIKVHSIFKKVKNPNVITNKIRIGEHNRNDLTNKLLISPIDAVIHREIRPISKSYPVQTGEVPLVDDKNGDNWKRKYIGPTFLSKSKSINSAEMGEIAVNYDKDETDNQITQRLQHPLNAEVDDVDASSFYQFGDLKFYIKEIDGTGFSIGFNQYLGEPPDDDSIKSFTGIENLIKTYGGTVTKDEHDGENEIDNSINDHETIEKRHAVVRRSTGGKDYQSNEYKIIFNNNYLPFDNYEQVFEDKNNKIQVSVHKEDDNNNFDSNITSYRLVDGNKFELPFGFNGNIFNKPLKPSEILDLANLLSRNKRAIKVTKFSKVNKSKISRFLNTNIMAPKRIFLKNKQSKRIKRQIDKIRIVASDNIQRNSDENVYVLSSNENIYGDRSFLREEEIPENADPNDNDAYYSPYSIDAHQQPSYLASMIAARSRHNSLMSKYPHVFMEEISRSKEDTENPYLYTNWQTDLANIEQLASDDFTKTTSEAPPILDVPIARVKEIVDAIAPRANYKLTVKILPKNDTKNSPGFKEIHTSINKSINKDGILYESLLNVSEVSKVEKVVNKTYLDAEMAMSSPLLRLIKSQQEKMMALLRKHRDKIDEQIANLDSEKESMNNIVSRTDKRIDELAKKKKLNEYIEVRLPSNPPQLLHLTKDEAGKLITSALLKLREAPHFSERTTTASTTTTSTTTTNPPTETTTNATTTKSTTAPETTTELDKTRIMKTIEKHENLTQTILAKIDRNTEILHKFLQKLTEKIDAVSKKKEDNLEILRKPVLPQTHWKDKIRDPFFHPMPNLELMKNDTHMSIPFVYAYQQPYPLNHSANKASNVASVIYQGHIHTNAVKNSNDPRRNAVIGTNKPKFFIDNIDPEAMLKTKIGNFTVKP